MASVAPARAVTAAIDRFSRLPAGNRLIVLLTLALLPLGLLAVLASLQTSRSADLERRAAARIAAAESARRFGSELAIDTTTLQSAANLLERGGAEEDICARTTSVLAMAATSGEPIRYALRSRAGRLICGAADVAAQAGDRGQRGDRSTSISESGLLVVVASDTGAYVGAAHYPRDRLEQSVRPASFDAPFSLAMSGNGRVLPIVSNFQPSPIERRESLSAPIPGVPIALMFTVRSAPFTPAELLTISVPIIMWLVASFIAWLVFDRLVIGPLGQLRANVANYQPGEILQPLRRMTIPAREIEELGQTFQAISTTVARHEEELAAGLNRQMRLTREVHHRVKNNLQVVSSLINLHARAAHSAEASAAYASIGRRVDALAVVHRNHFAELEENRGVNLRSLLGELSANLRATAAGESARLTILIDVASVHVSQDVAIPIAFLTTELVELATTIEPAATLRVSVLRQPEPEKACLVVASTALKDSERLQALMSERYGRVLEGLSRQLRSSLESDGEVGSFSVCFPLAWTDPSHPKK